MGGANGGYTFTGNGTGNQATFTSEGPSTTLSVTGLQSANPSESPLTGGTVTFSLPAGPVLCSSVPVGGHRGQRQRQLLHFVPPDARIPGHVRPGGRHLRPPGRGPG